MNENLTIKLVDKLVEKKFEYWKEEFIKKLKERISEKARTNEYAVVLSDNEVNEVIDKLAKEHIK